ncbi:MAG: MFS transporter [Micavibrio aeruginosavorus]|uniref:MFS transporter n=1 Tax=Micavibrio aeruginosavorus TaxID=349221 RepID=A0A2W5MYB5_9BACT|nr:MAG: MFS transporter [Micavibrio aeruginosavorus]
MPARKAALSMLDQIFSQKKMLDSVLERDRGYLDLPPRDRAFVRMMVATILRRRGQIDDLIARAMNKGEEPRPETLKFILYIGVVQIMFMDVANHAAVDTAVNLASHNGLESKKGFVNAVLRRIAGEEGRKWLADQDAASLNIPEWLYLQWINSYGAVRAREIGNACLTEAPLDFTVKDPAQKEEWARKLAARILPTGSLRRPAGGHVADLEGFEDGAWWIQDASSALPVRLFGDVAGKTVLDLCAAPGGKTAQLAAAGAKVVALDRSASRMKTLGENLARLGFAESVQTIVEDGAGWQSRETFKYILLDAPCTATGTIRRHPDLMALKHQKDQDGLMSIQERLLVNAAALLEKGGLLIYCTCSLQKAEGEGQIQRFLHANGNFRRIPVRKEELGGLDGVVNSEGDVRVTPQILKDDGGMDGFFISRLQKIS